MADACGGAWRGARVARDRYPRTRRHRQRSRLDGLAAPVLTKRALERWGTASVEIVAAAKGERPHHPLMQARLRAREPAMLVVVDMGSRGGPIRHGVPTLVIDHHQPRGLPPGAVVVSAFGHEPAG